MIVAEMAIESKADVKYVCSQIGHLFKEGRKVTVTIWEKTEAGNTHVPPAP